MNVDGSAQVRLGGLEGAEREEKGGVNGGGKCPRERKKARSHSTFDDDDDETIPISITQTTGRGDPQEPLPARLRPRRGRVCELQAREGEPYLLDRQGAGKKREKMKMKSNRRYFIFFVLGGISPSVSPSLTSSHLLSSLPPSSPSSSLPPLSTSFHPRHQVYEPIYADFGPLNLGKTYRFCARTAELLEVRLKKFLPLPFFFSENEREKKRHAGRSSRVEKRI